MSTQMLSVILICFASFHIGQISHQQHKGYAGLGALYKSFKAAVIDLEE